MEYGSFRNFTYLSRINPVLSIAMRKYFYSLLLLTVTGIGVNAQVPTWSENTACIFYTNCVKCHHPGGPGPFSLLDYNSAYTARYQIKAAVQTRYMPPWPPDHNYQTYAHERLLSQQEIDIISDWVDGGAPKGDTTLAPTPPVFSTNSQLSTIDWSGVIPTYTNAATQDDYRCFVIPTGLATATNIAGIEIMPGNGSMVHHVLVYTDTAYQVVINDNNDPGIGYTNFGGTGSNTSKLIGAWVPGMQPMFFPSGMGVKLQPNSYIILQIHYPQGTNGGVDSTRINLQYASGSVREVSLDPILNHITTLTNGPLIIGPNSTKTFYAQYTIPSITPLADKYTILSVFPHMHKVGRNIKSYAILPTNDTVNLISIPDWDFKWQGGYSFRQPLVLPEGTILKSEAFYDNTVNNPDAPNPNNWVFAGEATDDEMMIIYFSWLYAFPGDENIVVDTVTVKPTYNNCQFTTNLSVGQEDMVTANFNLYPNPTHDVITFSYYQPASGPFSILISDLSGRVVYRYENDHLSEGSYVQTLDTDQIAAGTYVVVFRSGNGTFAKRFVVSR